MGIEQILEKIDGDAAGEAEKILATAATVAARVRADWEERAREEIGRRRQAIAEEAERIRRQAVAEARLEGTKTILARRREWFGRVVEAAVGRLLENNSSRGAAILEAMAARHLTEGPAAVTISGDPAGVALADRRRERLEKSGVTVAVAGREEPPRGGMIVRRGQVLLNLSFDRLLADLAERRQADLQRLLFGGNDGRDA